VNVIEASLRRQVQVFGNGVIWCAIVGSSSEAVAIISDFKLRVVAGPGRQSTRPVLSLCDL